MKLIFVAVDCLDADNGSGKLLIQHFSLKAINLAVATVSVGVRAAAVRVRRLTAIQILHLRIVLRQSAIEDTDVFVTAHGHAIGI